MLSPNELLPFSTLTTFLWHFAVLIFDHYYSIISAFCLKLSPFPHQPKPCRLPILVKTLVANPVFCSLIPHHLHFFSTPNPACVWGQESFCSSSALFCPPPTQSLFSVFLSPSHASPPYPRPPQHLFLSEKNNESRVDPLLTPAVGLGSVLQEQM